MQPLENNIFVESVFLILYYLQRYKKYTIDTILIRYCESKQFQGGGESSKEPLYKGADHQLTLFPAFRSILGLHLTLATPGFVRPLPNAWVFEITENSASLGLFIESTCKLK